MSNPRVTKLKWWQRLYVWWQLDAHVEVTIACAIGGVMLALLMVWVFRYSNVPCYVKLFQSKEVQIGKC